MQLNNSEEIYNLIKEKTNLLDEELKLELNKIKERYQGLLSEVGAHIMLAKQHDIDLTLKDTQKYFTISEFSPSLESVSFYARIKSISPIRTYKTKDGGTGKMQSIMLSDGTGEIRLNLWQEKASLISNLDLDINSLVLIKDAFVTTNSFQDSEHLELSLRYGGSIILNPPNAPEIPKIKENLRNLSEINEAENELVSVIGRIINIYPQKEFEDSQQKTKKVLNFEISDGLRTMRCVAWDTWVPYILDNFKKGDLIKLCFVKIKEGLYDLELNINWNSTIIKNPKTKKEIPSLHEIISSLTSIQSAQIKDLEDGGQYKIEGIIVSINRNNIRYFRCPTCSEKVVLIDDNFICEKCNSVVEPVVNLFGSMDIDDGTGILKIVFFRELVEKVYDLNPNDFKKDINEEQKIDVFDKLEDKLLGKKVVVTGKAKLNSFSQNIELLANTIEFV